MKNNFIKRMGHAAIFVEDTQRSLHFYQDILGMEAKWISKDWAQVSIGQDDLSLIQKEEAKHYPHLGFRMLSREALGKFHQYLKTKNIYAEEIKVHRDESESFYFRDPDGNWLEALWSCP